MSLLQKSEDNSNLVNYCIRSKVFLDSGASRAYYSAFQRLKYHLLSNDFDYQKFLEDRQSDNREFSHGTIKAAFFEWALGKGKNLSDYSQLGVIDNLYKKRRKADYKDKKITLPELENSQKELKMILDLVNSL